MPTEQHKPQLPPGWRWNEDDRHVIRDVPTLGWFIEVTFDTHAPWDGPTGLLIAEDHSSDESVQSIADTSGLTTGVLRSIPLGEIRREYKEVQKAIRAALGRTEEPTRVESDTDLAFVASHYAELVTAGHRSPIAEMAEVWAVGKKTMSARVQRARARGLLEGEKHKPATKLTDKARQLIAEAHAPYEGGQN